MELRTAVLLTLLSLTVVHTLAFSGNETAPGFPAVLVFGDSIMDPGNNNVIPTIVKCNFPPYGMDFAGHKATGRFSNGKIPSDLLASAFGVKDLVPAYLSTELTSQDILTGVSFASGGSGYDPLTAIIASVISMPDQLNLFKEYKERLKAIAGEKRAASIISKSLYIICAGSDDLANNYFINPYLQSHYDIPSYVNLMIASASSFLEQLYLLGAQKIGFVGLPPVGCLPSQRTLAGGIHRGCEPLRNEAASMFNAGIRKENERLASKLEGLRIVYVDIYSSVLNLIQEPSIYGFQESSKGCCGTGELEVSILCNSKTSSTCLDNTMYVFWDSYHPTERAYQIIVDKVKGDVQDLL